MPFFVPFALGAAAAAAGFHFFKQCKKEGECSCGCNSASSLKKKVASSADFALEKIRSGLNTLESNIDETTLEKVKNGLKTAESKIAALQEKLKDQPSA
jgi:hypothetical protein